MRMFDFHPARLAPSARSLALIAVVAAFSSTLLGCPDKASPDPAAGKDGGTTAASTAPVAPKAGASAAAPAKSGGW